MPVDWSTVDGKFSTKKKCELVFALPLFSRSKKIFYAFHIACEKIKLGYDAIAGTDFLATLRITLNFENKTMYQYLYSNSLLCISQNADMLEK